MLRLLNSECHFMPTATLYLLIGRRVLSIFTRTSGREYESVSEALILRLRRHRAEPIILA
jgi:hypothetical protein